MFEAKRPAQRELLECPACGQRFADPDATLVDEPEQASASGLAPGQQLEGYLIEKLIGSGAMGQVYRATQLSLQRTVALKVLPPAFLQIPAFVERFHVESDALSALNHPNIVTIIDRGNVGDVYYFVMEYVDGPSLLSLMSGKPFSDHRFLNIAKGVAAALDYAHQRGVVHRDIKPSNIMLDSLNEVKIADFGLAGLIAQERKAAKNGGVRPRQMGTPAYMSPEQRIDPLDVDGRSDIFSAGIVFYELLTGQRPEIPVARLPSQVTFTADPRLDPVIDKCLRMRREERYQTAGELLEALEQFESELARAPKCPDCGRVSPVRFTTCAYCGRSLEEFFDICPECKQENRRDVRQCFYCGADQERGRTIIREKASMMLDAADRARLHGQFDEALSILKEVCATEGRAFEEQRARAEALLERTRAERRQAALRNFAEGQRLLRENRFAEAIKLFKQVPPDVRDTTQAINTARQLQTHLAGRLKARHTMNLIIIAVVVLALMALLVLRPWR